MNLEQREADTYRKVAVRWPTGSRLSVVNWSWPTSRRLHVVNWAGSGVTATRERPPRVATRGRLADFTARAAARGLPPAARLAAFDGVPAPAQAAMWRDLADRLDRERRAAGWTA